MSRIAVLARPPAAHARGAGDRARRRRPHGGLRRRLHRHLGEPGQHVRDRHAADLQQPRRRRRSSARPDMRPGDPPATGTVDIANAGSLSGAFTLTRGTPDDSDADQPAVGQAQPRRRATAARSPAPARPPAAPATARRLHRHARRDDRRRSALGTFAGGEKHRFRFSVALDASAGQRLPGRHVVGRVHLGRGLAASRWHRAAPAQDVVSTLLLAAGVLLGARAGRAGAARLGSAT